MRFKILFQRYISSSLLKMIQNTLSLNPNISRERPRREHDSNFSSIRSSEPPLPGFYYDSIWRTRAIKRIKINQVSCQSEQDRFVLEQFRASYRCRLDSFFSFFLFSIFLLPLLKVSKREIRID